MRWIGAGLLALALFCPLLAYANTCEVLGSNTQDTSGNAVKGAQITIRLAGTQTLAHLYNSKDCTTEIDNPITSGTTGEWSVYVKDGRYDIYTAKTGLSFQTKFNVPNFLPLGQNEILIQEFTDTLDICAPGIGMIAQVGSRALTVVINEQRFCTQDATIGANLRLRFVGNGKITRNAGSTITIPDPSHILAPPTQMIFDGDGLTLFSIGGQAYWDWWGVSVSATATANSAALANAIAAMPASGSDIRFATTGSYHLASTMILIDKVNFHLAGIVPGNGGGADVSTRLVWDGAPDGTMLMLDGVRDAVIEDLQFVSGANNFGVGVDWDKVNAVTQISSHVTFRRVFMLVPSAGIGYRLANVIDTNTEDGLFEDCYIIGPSTTPGSRGTSIGVQIRSSNSINHLWSKGAISGVSVAFDLPSNIGGKASPAGQINVIGGDMGNSDIFLRAGSGMRRPLIISHVSMEFFDALIANNGGQSSNELVVSFIGNRIVPPSAETVPYIDIRQFATLTLIGNSFTDGQGANASLKIAVTHNDDPGARIVSIGNSYPNSAPFDTSKKFCLNSGGDSYYDSSYPNLRSIDSFVGCYNRTDVLPSFTLGQRLKYTPCAYTDADVTPSVGNCNYMVIANTGAKTLTQFDDGTDGQVLYLQFADGNTTINDGGNFKLTGNFTSSADDTVILLNVGGSTWYELGRSVN